MANSTLTFNSQPRTLNGRKVRQLRSQGILPANIFGKGMSSISIQISRKDFAQLYTTAGETKVINLSVEGDSQTHPVLITEVQTDPLTDAPVHVDFRQVNLLEKISAPIPVELTGEAPATAQGNVVIQMLSEIEVEALPNDLPESFIVDISKLENVDDALFVSDLAFDRNKVTLQIESEAIIVKVEAPAAEEEEPAQELTPDDVEITGEKPKDESETSSDDGDTTESSE